MESLNLHHPCLPKTLLLRAASGSSGKSHLLCHIHRGKFAVSCKQDSNKNGNFISNKILLSEKSPPPLSEQKNDEPENGKQTVRATNGTTVLLVKRLPRKVLSLLSNLPLAIGEMATIAALMALGTSKFNFFS